MRRFARTAPQAGTWPAVRVPSAVLAGPGMVEGCMGEFLTTDELRALFVRTGGGIVHHRTVMRWIEQGRIRPAARGPHGVNLYRRSDAERLLAEWDPETGRMPELPAQKGRARDAAKVLAAMREDPTASRLSLSRRAGVNYRWVYRYIGAELDAGRIRQVDGRWEIAE